MKKNTVKCTRLINLPRQSIENDYIALKNHSHSVVCVQSALSAMYTSNVFGDMNWNMFNGNRTIFWFHSQGLSIQMSSRCLLTFCCLWLVAMTIVAAPTAANLNGSTQRSHEVGSIEHERTNELRRKIVSWNCRRRQRLKNVIRQFDSTRRPNGRIHWFLFFF